MKSKIFLTNTDTTIGFISQDRASLDKAKKRLSNKEYILALPNLNAIKRRVPKKFRKFVRRAKKSTFILSRDYSFRVIKDKKHKLLIDRLKWAYTTSANLSGKEYDETFAKNRANIIVYPLKKPKEPSKIYKLSKEKKKRIR